MPTPPLSTPSALDTLLSKVIKVNGVLLPVRAAVNFEGSGLSGADDPDDNETTVSVAGAGSAAGTGFWYSAGGTLNPDAVGLSGDGSLGALSGGSVSFTLAASGVTAGTYGDATHVAQVTVDGKGRVTTATSVAISGGGGGGAGYGTYASRPSPGTAGALYIASDGIVPFVDDGSHWRPLLLGVPGIEAAPGNSLSAFTQVGLTPSVSNVAGGCPYVSRVANDATDSLCGYEVAKTSGQTLIANVLCNPNPAISTELAGAGVWVRDTSGQKYEAILFFSEGSSGIRLAVFQALSLSSSNSAVSALYSALGPSLWLKIQDTGSDLVFSYSLDGVNYAVLYTDTGPYVPSRGNAYGFGVDPYNAPSGITVRSWSVS